MCKKSRHESVGRFPVSILIHVVLYEVFRFLFRRAANDVAGSSIAQGNGLAGLASRRSIDRTYSTLTSRPFSTAFALSAAMSGLAFKGSKTIVNKMSAFRTAKSCPSPDPAALSTVGGLAGLG